jgi:16S rRNA (guanine(966)-N(2))-methyltransferase RsmD
MSVRITGGRLRGRSVDVLDAPDLRPTPSMAREALFSMIGQHLDGWRVVDLCAGSGVMAAECASRGATVVAIERNPRTAAALVRSLALLDAGVDVRVGDAARVAPALPTGAQLVYIDPPFREDPLPWIQLGAALLPERLVLEHPPTYAPPGSCGALQLDRRRVYGGSAIALYLAR